MTVEQLQLGTERAWKLAYGWRSIASRLAHSPAPLHVRLITNLGYRFYAHNLHRFYNCDWILGWDRPDDAGATTSTNAPDDDSPLVPVTIAGSAVR